MKKASPLHPYHIVMESGKKVLISDCKKIIEYTPEMIRILLHTKIISICGKDLTLSDFFGDEIQICGVIKSVDLSGEENEK